MNTTIPEHTANSLMQEFDFGEELTALHMYHLIGKHNPVILEIGANCGQSTVTFTEQMPNATVYCFEPDPRAISKFKRMIQHPNVHLIEAAVGANSGHVMFKVPAQNTLILRAGIIQDRFESLKLILRFGLG